MISTNILVKAFEQNFSKKPDILINAPGRINLIGEHTDYNDGFVMPAAIDKSILLAGTKNNLKSFRFFSLDYNKLFEIPIDKLEKSELLWPDYLIGVIVQIRKLGFNFEGLDMAFGGDIPIGAGLSSSAALETGFALMINELFHLKMEKMQIVKLSQAAENQFVGVNCGIMDQFASVFGKKKHFVQLDCRSLEYEYAPFETDEYSLLLLDTQVKHSLASSAYNTRRQECETAVGLLQHDFANVLALRDVRFSDIQKYKPDWETNIYERAKYVTQENERVNSVVERLKKSDFKSVGQLMFETHQGLSKDYLVSCTELDFLVDLAQKNSNIIGARMMGGGFGGCTINLVKKGTEQNLIEQFSHQFKQKFNIQLKHYLVNISEGTSIV